MVQALISTDQRVFGQLVLPGSKSITNRALLLAALARGQSVLSGCLQSEDSQAFVKALISLGVLIEVNADQITVVGTGGFQKNKATVWCQDAGTAARFLLAACSAFPGEFQIDGTARLCERPLAPLIHVLKQLGAAIDAMQLPCTVKGGVLTGGALEVEASLSTQFVSALLMIAPFMKTPLALTAKSLNRRAYIDLTINMMQQFGVQVSEKDKTFLIQSDQRYQARDYTIEPDLSTATYFFAAAALTAGQVTVMNIDRVHCIQGDVRFLDVLEKMGCTVIQESKGVTVQGPKKLRGVEVDMQDFSDPFMTLAAIAPYADSPTFIKGLAHTRLQESDRVDAIATELTKLHVKVETGPDWIRIHPGTPVAAKLFSHNDHRIAMSLAVLALKTPGIILENPQCVAKTCPAFYDLFRRCALTRKPPS